MRLCIVFLMIGLGILLDGCSSVSYEVPASLPQSKMNFNRNDIAVMDAVTGESVKKWYFFGLVQSIDGHLIIFGFSNYQVEKSAGISVFDEVIQRAHYNALIKAPEADYLLSPKYTIKENGFIPFFYRKEVTIKGKPVIVKTDSQLK